MSVRIPVVGTPISEGEVELKSEDWNDSFEAVLKDGAYDAYSVNDLKTNRLAVFNDIYSGVYLPNNPTLGDFVKVLLKNSTITISSNSSNIWYADDSLVNDFSISSENFFSELLTDSGSWIYSVSFGENYLAVGSRDENVYIYDVSDWNLLQTLTDPTDIVNSVSFGENYLAVGAWDNNVYVYDVSDWSLVQTLTDSGSDVYSVSFGGNYLAVGSRDNNVYVYDNFLVGEVSSNTIAKNNVELIYNGSEWVIKD